MLVEEVVDGLVSGAFDFPIDVVLLPRLERDLVELVVVARVAVADVGAGGELRRLLKTEQLSATHAAAADDRRVCRGVRRDLLGQPGGRLPGGRNPRS